MSTVNQQCLLFYSSYYFWEIGSEYKELYRYNLLTINSCCVNILLIIS